MSRTLLSVLLCLAVTVRTTLALSCYQCADLEALTSIPGANAADGIDKSLLNNAAVAAAIPPCKEFKASDDRFKKQCETNNVLQSTGIEEGCMKTVIGDATIRGCQQVVPATGCQEVGKMMACLCTGDFCNSAGLMSLSPLLLLLPAALLAALIRA